MRHEAIRELYPNVVTIDDEAGSFDSNNDTVVVDESLVSSKTAELVAAQAVINQNTADKLTGIEFGGVMCSAKSKDMYGLESIKGWVAAGNNTVFEFENGNKLSLTSANIDAFEAALKAFRASFFGQSLSVRCCA